MEGLRKSMCTSIVSNRKKTIIGWNLDVLDMEYKVVAQDDMVCIAIKDAVQGWLPLFGANSRGDFIAMPTCHPFDDRSNPINSDDKNIIMLNIDLLLQKMSFKEIKGIVEKEMIYSVPEATFMAQLSDKNGDVLQIISGQGYRFKEKPTYSILTNFSPLKGNSEYHPWMGMDRYKVAKSMLEAAGDDFNVVDCFEILKATSQEICPTVVSMVFDVESNTVYWCENREWRNIQKFTMI